MHSSGQVDARWEGQTKLYVEIHDPSLSKPLFFRSVSLNYSGCALPDLSSDTCTHNRDWRLAVRNILNIPSCSRLAVTNVDFYMIGRFGLHCEPLAMLWSVLQGLFFAGKFPWLCWTCIFLRRRQAKAAIFLLRMWLDRCRARALLGIRKHTIFWWRVERATRCENSIRNTVFTARAARCG